MKLPNKFDYINNKSVKQLSNDELTNIFSYLHRHNDIKTIKINLTKLSNDCRKILERYYDYGSDVPGISNVNESIVKMILYSRINKFAVNDDENDMIKLANKLRSEIVELEKTLKKDQDVRETINNKKLILERLNITSVYITPSKIYSVALTLFKRISSFEHYIDICNSFEYIRSGTRSYKKKNYGKNRNNNKNNNFTKTTKTNKSTKSTKTDKSSNPNVLSKQKGTKVYTNVKPMWKTKDTKPKPKPSNLAKMDSSDTFKPLRKPRNNKSDDDDVFVVKRRRNRNGNASTNDDNDSGYISIDKLVSNVDIKLDSKIEFPEMSSNNDNNGTVDNSTIDNSTINNSTVDNLTNTSNITISTNNTYNALLLWDEEEVEEIVEDKVVHVESKYLEVTSANIDKDNNDINADNTENIKNKQIKFSTQKVNNKTFNTDIFNDKSVWTDYDEYTPLCLTHASIDGRVIVKDKMYNISSFRIGDYSMFENNNINYDSHDQVDYEAYSDYEYDDDQNAWFY